MFQTCHAFSSPSPRELPRMLKVSEIARERPGIMRGACLSPHYSWASSRYVSLSSFRWLCRTAAYRRGSIGLGSTRGQDCFICCSLASPTIMFP